MSFAIEGGFEFGFLYLLFGYLKAELKGLETLNGELSKFDG